MKKLVLILVLSFFVHLSFSQDWHPVTPNGVYHYTNQNTSFATHTIFADSFETDSNKTTYYLNRILKNCDTCTWLFKYLKKQYYPITNEESIVHFDGNQFMQKKINVYNNGDLVFENPNHFYLKTTANVNDIWMFDSNRLLMAKVLEKTTRVVFGQTDSVIVFYISGNRKVVLSKHFGILTFLDIDGNDSYNLIGMEGNKNGYNMPTPKKINDFNVGEMFRYRYYSAYAGNPTPSITDEYTQYEIVKRTNQGNSTMYEIEGAINKGRPKLAYETFDSTINFHNDRLKELDHFVLNKLYNHQVVEDTIGQKVYEVFFFEDDDGLWRIRFTGMSFDPLKSKSDNFRTYKKLQYFPATYKDFYVPDRIWMHNYFDYSLKIGFVKSEWGAEGYSLKEELLGYVKYGVKYGEINSIYETPKSNQTKNLPKPSPGYFKYKLFGKSCKKHLNNFQHKRSNCF
jgi:hypothetical protein